MGQKSADNWLFSGAILVCVWVNVVVVAYVLALLVDAKDPVVTLLGGLVMLNIPLIGLFAICNQGRPQFRVTENGTVNTLVWFGWILGLIAGLGTIVQGVAGL